MTINWTEFGKAIIGSGFEETVTYHPYEDQPKSIKAVVERAPTTIMEHGGRAYHGKIFEAFIMNDATLGVTRIRKGFDKIELPFTQGGENISMVVAQILEEDPSGWKVELRA